MAKAKKAATPQPPRAAAHPAVRAGAPKAGAKGKAKKATPQPPAPEPGPGPTASTGGNYGLQYNPSLESQLNQPYQDVIATGAMSTLPGAVGATGGAFDLGNVYGQQGANTLGAYGAMLGPLQQQMQGLSNQILGYQQGTTDLADPMLKQNYQVQGQQLQDQLRAQLGPDYANSSAGAQALALFNQTQQNALAESAYNTYQGYLDRYQQGMGQLNQAATGQGGTYGALSGQGYNQALGLRNYQLGGQAAMLQNTGAQMGLYENVPQMTSNFGTGMAGLSSGAVSAQGPYQQDRALQAQMSTYPTSTQFMGQMMGQSGNRWAQIGSSIGSMGGQASQAGSQAGGG